ncbi:MAG: restriction endonuclease subunit S, partial [Alkalispirochaeta sp.]
MIDFVLRNLVELATLPGSVPKLRSFILDQAVRGNLTADWRRDNPDVEPASVLLERIRQEKQELVKAGKIKKQKELPPVEPGEVPFAVPESWEWVRLGDVFVTVTDGDHLPPPKAPDGVPFLVIGDIREGTIDTKNASRFVSRKYYDGLDWSRIPRKGTILYTLVGSLGIPVLVQSDAKFCVQRHIGLLQPSSQTNTEYLRHLLESDLTFEQASNVATGIAQKTVPLSGLRSIIEPIPPTVEQTEIVRRVDELMALCDQ